MLTDLQDDARWLSTNHTFWRVTIPDLKILWSTQILYNVICISEKNLCD